MSRRRIISFEPEEQRLKILGVSMDSARPAMAYAAYDGRTLAIVGVDELRGSPASLREKIETEIKAKNQDRYAVIVEDRTGYFAHYGTPFSFEARDESEGRINLYVALDYYFAMSNTGFIVMAQGVERYALTESKVDPQQDDKGRKKYNVNWQSFLGAHRAILLCVMAAMREPASERVLHEIFRDVKYRPDEYPAAIRTIMAIQRIGYPID